MERETEADGQLRLGAALSLSGRYAFLGRQAAAGLRALVQDARSGGGVRTDEGRLLPRLGLLDDEGTQQGVRRGLDALVEADVLFGPYGSDLVREAARWAAERGRVLWNHGGSADRAQRAPGVVSVASPASRYFAPVLEALAGSLPGARVLLAAGGGRFGRGVADGVEEAAGGLGMEVAGTVATPEEAEFGADVLLLAGSFEEDVEFLRRLRRRPRAVAAVAAAMSTFRSALGPEADGVLGPSQWEEGVHHAVDVGPRQAEAVRSLRAEALPQLQPGPGHVDYPAAQAYATGLIALRCVEETGRTDERALLEVARRLRATTFFGRFGLGEDGRQRDHEVLAVQWQEGVKRVVGPPHLAEVPVLS